MVANPEDRFSRDMAPMVLVCGTIGRMSGPLIDMVCIRWITPPRPHLIDDVVHDNNPSVLLKSRPLELS